MERVCELYRCTDVQKVRVCYVGGWGTALRAEGRAKADARGCLPAVVGTAAPCLCRAGPWLPEERRPEWAKTRSREARETAVQERGKRWLGPE